MFGSTVLEIATGVAFVYLFISLICSAVNELLASALNKRGKNLFEGIKNLLNDPTFTGLAQQVYNHGLIDGITRHASGPTQQRRLPSYIPAANFSLALLDILSTTGIVAAAHAPLLTAAERADDAYETARAAEAASGGDSTLSAATLKASADRDAARAAVENAARQAEALAQEAERAAAAAPADAALREAAARARTASDVAAAAIKILDARRAAVAAAASPRQAALAIAASDALEDALDAGRRLAAAAPNPLATVTAALERLPRGHTKEALLVLAAKTAREAQTAGNAVDLFRINIETWFNDSMGRVGGWYKRWTQQTVLAIALVVVCVANADTITIIKRLASDGPLRAALAVAAQNAVTADARGPAAPDDTRIQLVLTEAESLDLPLGWSTSTDAHDLRRVPRTARALAVKIGGLLLSIFAVSLGAPFWFDTLSKFVNIRGAGTPPGEAKKGAA